MKKNVFKDCWNLISSVYGLFIIMIDHIERDRLYHFIVGLLITAIFGICFNFYEWSMLAAIIAGLIKECIDRFIQKEKFDWIDLLATSLGGLFIAICFSISRI